MSATLREALRDLIGHWQKKVGVDRALTHTDYRNGLINARSLDVSQLQGLLAAHPVEQAPEPVECSCYKLAPTWLEYGQHHMRCPNHPRAAEGGRYRLAWISARARAYRLAAALEAARTHCTPAGPVVLHKPFPDDGVTYCGWATGDRIVDGCGEVWPCSSVRAESKPATPAATLDREAVIDALAKADGQDFDTYEPGKVREAMYGHHADAILALVHPVPQPTPVVDMERLVDALHRSDCTSDAHDHRAPYRRMAEYALAAGVFKTEAEVQAAALEDEAERAKVDALQQRKVNEEAGVSEAHGIHESELHFWQVHNRLLASAAAIRAGGEA